MIAYTSNSAYNANKNAAMMGYQVYVDDKSPPAGDLSIGHAVAGSYYWPERDNNRGRLGSPGDPSDSPYITSADDQHEPPPVKGVTPWQWLLSLFSARPADPLTTAASGEVPAKG